MQLIIAGAILEVEQNTCLQFRQQTVQTSYVEFTSTSEDVCYSSYVGKNPNKKQYIMLGPRCYSYQIVLHEIGHAIGLWHEQSRPDRDDYIQVAFTNVDYPYNYYQFLKRSYNEAQSEGIVYDYASIMHYPLNAFSYDTQNINTIRIINDEEYVRQGRPHIGYNGHLSDKDIQQIRLLYECDCRPNCQYTTGILVIYAQRGHNLFDQFEEDDSNLDLYIKVTAYDRDGNSLTRTTEHVQGNVSPVWNERLNFGTSTWTQFIIQAINVNKDSVYDNAVTSSRSYNLESFASVECEKICANDECESYFTFNYYFEE